MNLPIFLPEGWEKKQENIAENKIEEFIDNQEILQGVVHSCDSKYNLHVYFANGKKGVIPRNEIAAINVNQDGYPRESLCVGKVHSYVQFKIKEKKDENFILSRKDVQKDVIKWIREDLQEGQKICGIVKNIKPYGAFVEIGGGVVGLIHIEDLSVARIKTPLERVKIGQKINVMVKYIDRKSARIGLSYKEILGTWEENVKNFQEGTEVSGIVRETEKHNNGIFIELTPNLVGMAEYKENVEYGQKVKVYIKRIIQEKHKIKLVIV